MSDKPLAVAAHDVETSGSRQLERESTVWLSWADEALILLPPD